MNLFMQSPAAIAIYAITVRNRTVRWTFPFSLRFIIIIIIMINSLVILIDMHAHTPTQGKYICLKLINS